MTGNLFSSDSSPSLPWFTAHCDGGSRGNPGPSGYGAVIENPEGRIVARLSHFLGIQTNNFAEYSGLLAVLHWAAQNGTTHLRVVSDSELMVKQMQGKYKVASPTLRPLFDQARKLSRQFERFEISHTLRGGNKEADRLANEAMDKGMGKGGEQPSAARDRGAGDRESASGLRAPAARPYGKLETGPAPAHSANAQPTAAPRQILEGYVKNGVVHLLEGELPEGVFVKVIRQ